MANDFNLNEFKLKDPVRSIPDGLQEPVKDATPGFFSSLRNPYHLMLEESLPASLYQWMTGNTKKKQAQEALEWIRNNPDQKDSKIYKTAERKLQRFGYLLDDGPMSIDLKEVGNMIKANPKMFGAELVNMFMADPWLMVMPLGWHRLGRGTVNAIRLKYGKNLQLSKIDKKLMKADNMADVKVGAAATLLTPLVFSSTWQLGEDATLDPKRTTVETTLGATAGAVLSVGFAGTGALISKFTGLSKPVVHNFQNKTYNKPEYKKHPERLTDYDADGSIRPIGETLENIKTEVNETFIGVPRKLDIRYEDIKSPQAMAFFRRSEDGGAVFMDIKRINEAYNKKAWTKPRITGVDPLPENQFKTPKDFQDFIYYHELSHWQNPRLPGETLGVYENRMNKLALNTANKAKLDAEVTKDILNSKPKFDAIKADITVGIRALNETAKDMAIANSLKVAATLGAVGGVAQFLTADDEKLLATAKGIGAGLAVYGAGKLLIKRLKNTSKELDAAALDVEAGLDAMRISPIKLNSSGHELARTIQLMIPDAIHSQPKVFYYITKAKVDPKTLRPPVDKFGKQYFDPKLKAIRPDQLTANELKAANAIKKIFDEFANIFGAKGAGLFSGFRANYLPPIWKNYNPAKQPFRFVEEFDELVTGTSPDFKFGKRSMYGDINVGLKKGLVIKPEFESPVELIKIYVNAASKALATRALIGNLERSKINGKPLLIRNIHIAPPVDGEYIKFTHPYFKDKILGSPHIHKGMEKSLKMVFDATDEPALTGALFTLNLMMKRLAVGFSFFHAGALVESMIFAGHKLKSIGRVVSPFSKKELQSFIDNPAKYKAEFPHAAQVLEKNGFQDLIQFAKGTGLQISTPEDIGFDRFYYNFSGLQKTSVDQFFKRHSGISPAAQAEKAFKWFDRVTWDRVFTHAKLNTFLTALNKTVKSGDNQAQIFQKAQRAAQFSNDAFGGQDWAKLANSIQTPWLKSMMQTTFKPGSRGYMQLLMFAPDWTISNLRIIAKSLPGFEKDPALRRLYQYYFLRAAVIYAAAGSALNYAFSGQSLLENTDPTRINLGDGEVLTFSKQLMEPFHWITAPQSTALKKIGALPRTTIEVLTNKKYLTTKWSPNITKEDDEAIEKGLKIGGQIGKRFLPIWLQTASQNISDGLQRDGLSADLAADTAVDFVLGQSGHPRYKGPRTSQYKTKGLVRSPYETLF